MSFYGSIMILDRPNHFGRVPMVLDRPNSFWSGPNNFGQVQIIKIGPEKLNLNLTKTIWTRPKRFRTYRRTGHKRVGGKYFSYKTWQKMNQKLHSALFHHFYLFIFRWGLWARKRRGGRKLFLPKVGLPFDYLSDSYNCLFHQKICQKTHGRLQN